MRRALLVLGATLLVAAAATFGGCDDDDGGGGNGDGNGPEPAPTSATPPALTAWATPPATGDTSLDEMVALVVAGDEAALRPLMRTYQEPCVEEQSPGSGALCRGDQEEGTEVDTFSTGVCDATGAHPEDVVLIPDGGVSLYAIVTRPGPNDSTDMYVIFRQHSGGPDFSYLWGEGQILALYAPCGGTNAFVAESTVIVAPPSA